MGGSSPEIKETSQEKAQARVAMERWNDYQTLFRPYEDKFMGKVDNMNSAASIQKASDLAISPIAKAFAEQAVNNNRNMMQGGVNPNSGKFGAMQSMMANAEAGAKMDSSSRGAFSQQDNYIAGLQNIAAMGQGQAGVAMNGLSDIASMSQRNAYASAQRSIGSRNNVRSGIGMIAGAGLKYGLDE